MIISVCPIFKVQIDNGKSNYYGGSSGVGSINNCKETCNFNLGMESHNMQKPPVVTY